MLFVPECNLNVNIRGTTRIFAISGHARPVFDIEAAELLDTAAHREQGCGRDAWT